MIRLKTYNATGVAPDGRLYAGDLNALEDAVAALDDDTQTIKLNALTIHDDAIQLVKYGTSEARITAALRVDNILRGLGGLIAGAFTTTQRNAITSPPYGLVILNTTTNRYEYNAGSAGSPSWAALHSATGLTNADIASAAAIARSKLDFGSGLVNADIATGAAIARAKLDFGSGLVNADVATAAAIAYAKLNLAGAVVNADIASAAAIAYSKLALTGSIVNADINASAAIAISKLASYPSDATKVLKGNGTWGTVSKAITGGALSTYELNADSYSGAGQGGMLGMGLTITPLLTGKVVIILESTLAGGWVNVAAGFSWRYGTGSAPANAAAVTGTSVGGTVYRGTGGNENNRGFSQCVVITGLSVGTAYWFDLAMVFTGDPQDGQTPGITDGNYVIEEVG